ncbi:MAG: rRNA maturation RNase YbeY [Chloroflexi bacterium]|nr:rRNA maturation RNase YbeY [Chloroflexota bacterium]
MVLARVQVQVFPPFHGAISARWLRRVAEGALATAAPGDDCCLSLVLADDATVRQLNHAYRGLDETTDVLAFAFDHSGPYEGEGKPPSGVDIVPFPSVPEPGKYLGEVIISYPQCVRQAKAQGHSVRQELALLVVHGVLHLLGHDHASPEEEQGMRALENSALQAVEREAASRPKARMVRS